MSDTYISVKIADTGSGIPADLLDQVFDPFVSTKQKTTGTGLGLSMVQGFVNQSGGFVRIDSEEGTGTSVTMFFPVDETQESESKVQHPPEPTRREANGSARILIAEDQDAVLSVLSRALKAAGYDVLGAHSGDDAYQYFQGDGPFDLLLTDVVMPGDKSGPQLAKACREIDPELPVVFMSGYASEALVEENGVYPEDFRLTKPVPKADLLAAIQTSLDRKA